MKKPQRVIWTVVGLLIFGLAVFFLPSSDPVYEGKRLSAWTADLDGYAGPKMEGAQEAIRHIGTNALPYIIQLLQTKNAPFKARVNQWLSKQSWIKFRHTTPETLRSRGLFACEALGTNARPAIPALTALVYDPSLSRHAASVLTGFGSEVIPILTNAAAHSDARVRWGAIAPLARLNDQSTVPLLLQCLKDPDYNVRGFATVNLGYVAKDPDVAIPALLGSLQDTNFFVRSAAAYRLELWTKYPQAKAAIPLLIRALHDTAQSSPSDGNANSLRVNAARTLKKLDPEAATAIGVSQD
jgi:hypothetical protein